MKDYIKNWLAIRQAAVEKLDWPAAPDAIPPSLDITDSVYRNLFQAEVDTRMTATLKTQLQ